jgi:hypothetical protein
VLELDDVGRLALAVLDGGLFAGSRVVELAAAYLEAGHEANEAMQVDDKTGEVGS